MIPSSAKIRGETRCIGKPKDWDDDLDGPCGALSVRDEVELQSGVNFMHSEWVLQPGELKLLQNHNGVVVLRISGVTHPVVSLHVECRGSYTVARGGFRTAPDLDEQAESLFGGKRKRSAGFFAGAVVLQTAASIDAFLRVATAGAEFVYQEAPEPSRDHDGWRRAGELAADGLVRTHQRRREGGGWEWYLVRTGKKLPRQVSPQEKVLADRATSAIFADLKLAANMGLPCPSDEALAKRVGLNSRDQAQWRIRELVRVGLIGSTLAYEGGIRSRVVTIIESRWAGQAAAKFTALPKKWAALRQVAERELREADERDLKRPRSAGL